MKMMKILLRGYYFSAIIVNDFLPSLRALQAGGKSQKKKRKFVFFSGTLLTEEAVYVFFRFRNIKGVLLSDTH